MSNNIQQTKTLVIWLNVDYNIGSGYDSTNGIFTAPVNGIYFFHAQTFIVGSNAARIYFYVNGSYTTFSTSDNINGGEQDTVTSTAQYKLNAGNTVHVELNGYYYEPNDSRFAHFEGHLIAEINE